MVRGQQLKIDMELAWGQRGPGIPMPLVKARDKAREKAALAVKHGTNPNRIADEIEVFELTLGMVGDLCSGGCAGTSAEASNGARTALRFGPRLLQAAWTWRTASGPPRTPSAGAHRSGRPPRARLVQSAPRGCGLRACLEPPRSLPRLRAAPLDALRRLRASRPTGRLCLARPSGSGRTSPPFGRSPCGPDAAA